MTYFKISKHVFLSSVNHGKLLNIINKLRIMLIHSYNKVKFILIFRFCLRYLLINCEKKLEFILKLWLTKLVSLIAFLLKAQHKSKVLLLLIFE